MELLVHRGCLLRAGLDRGLLAVLGVDDDGPPGAGLHHLVHAGERVVVVAGFLVVILNHGAASVRAPFVVPSLSTFLAYVILLRKETAWESEPNRGLRTRRGWVVVFL